MQRYRHERWHVHMTCAKFLEISPLLPCHCNTHATYQYYCLLLGQLPYPPSVRTSRNMPNIKALCQHAPFVSGCYAYAGLQLGAYSYGGSIWCIFMPAQSRTAFLCGPQMHCLFSSEFFMPPRRILGVSWLRGESFAKFVLLKEKEESILTARK